MENLEDPVLKSICRELRTKYRCHTIVLYGSRARGLTTPTSDYDVIGVRKKGSKTRIAKNQKGFFWDVFVYAEKDLQKLSEAQFSWKNAKILYQEGVYGTQLLRKIEKLIKTPYLKQPRYEIEVTKVWAQKEFERCRMGDIQGLYRRAEFLQALIDHYFFIRQKRYLGPKEGFAWLAKNDRLAFRLIQQALRFPTNLSHLKKAAAKVYMVKLK